MKDTAPHPAALRFRPGLLLLAMMLLVLSPLGVATAEPTTKPTADSASDGEPGAKPTQNPGLFHRLLPNLFDPQDGYFDLSHYLAKPFGFYPLVTPITEPAVGAGAAVVPLFISMPEDGHGRPNIWGGGAMATSNGSQGYFAGYSGYHGDGRWHLFGGAADASINLDFYGLGDLLTPSGDPLRYDLDITGGLVGADRRLGDSPWRLGLRYLYAEIDPSLVRSADAPRVELPEFTENFGHFDPSTTLSSVQVALDYDTRDSTFTPTEGLYSDLSFTANLPDLGATQEYQIVDWTGLAFHPLIEDRLFIGWRAEIMQSFGDVPFYRQPAINLRGVPLQRYQGAGLALTEAELRWQFHPRWSLVGFGGVGVTWPGDDAVFRQTQTVPAGGVGFRYLIARSLGLHVGIDGAFSDEDSAVYIQFGSAWFRP